MCVIVYMCVWVCLSNTLCPKPSPLFAGVRKERGCLGFDLSLLSPLSFFSIREYVICQLSTTCGICSVIGQPRCCPNPVFVSSLWSRILVGCLVWYTGLHRGNWHWWFSALLDWVLINTLCWRLYVCLSEICCVSLCYEHNGQHPLVF